MSFTQMQKYEEIIKYLPHCTLRHTTCTYVALSQFCKCILTTGNISFLKACKLVHLWRDDLKTTSFILLIPIFSRSS